MQLARLADQLGYDSIWVAEDFGLDAISQLAAFAVLTERIGLATGIVSVFGRTPAMLAQTAAGLDRISNGRFRFGLGTSSSVLANGWHGIPFDGALTRLSETIDVIRILLRSERLQYSGQAFQLTSGIRLSDRPFRESVPLYVGTLTPAGCRLAGEKADGWVAAYFSPGHHDEVFGPHLRAGLERRLSSLGHLRISVFQPIVLTSDRMRGRNLIRKRLARQVGLMGARNRNYYAQLFRRYGFTDEVDLIQQLQADRRRDDAAAAVSDEMVDLVTIVGDLDDSRERLRSFEAAHVDEVVFEVVTEADTPDAYVAAMKDLAHLCR